MNIKKMEDKVKVWIARDKDNRLFVFSERPNKEKDIWTLHGNYTLMELSFRKFPSVKWEDDEPTEAYITLAEPQEQPTPKQEIDWEQRRYEIAKEMMTEIYRHKIAVSEPGQAIAIKDIVDVAVIFADTLIKELKKQSE